MPSRQLLEEIEVLPEPPTQPSPVVQNICRSGRQTKKPDAYGEWVAHTAVAIATDTASGSTPTPTPIIEPPLMHEPQSYAQAIESEDRKQWEQAMDREYKSILQNDVWELVKLPPGRKVVGSRWVYKIKQGGLYKARFVSKGYSQRPRIRLR
jgi:hypothetical protein